MARDDDRRRRGLVVLAIFAFLAAALFLVPGLLSGFVGGVRTIATTVTETILQIFVPGQGVGETFGPGVGETTFFIELMGTSSWNCLPFSSPINLTVDSTPIPTLTSEWSGSGSILTYRNDSFLGSLGSPHNVLANVSFNGEVQSKGFFLVEEAQAFRLNFVGCTL